MSGFRFLTFAAVLIAFSGDTALVQAQAAGVAPPATLKCRGTTVPKPFVKRNGKTAWKCVNPGAAAAQPPAAAAAVNTPALAPAPAAATLPAANVVQTAVAPTPVAQPTPAVAPAPAVVTPPAANVVQTTIAPTPVALVKSAAELQADDFIAKNIAARGGQNAVAAINTVRMRGTARMAQGMEGDVLVEIERSGKVRTEITLQGMTAIQTYDGVSGWSLSPFLGQTSAQPVTGAALETLKAQADFEGLLINHEAKGAKVEFVGNEDVEGTPSHKLKVTRKNGLTLFVYLGTEDFLEFKTKESMVGPSGETIDLETLFGDYRSSGGVLFAHSVVQMLAGKPGGTNYTMNSIEVNPTLAASRFGKP